MFRFVFGIQMIKITKELVEAVHGGKEFVAIAKMILAELPSCVTLRLQQFGDRWILRGQALFCRGQAHLQQSRP